MAISWRFSGGGSIVTRVTTRGIFIQYAMDCCPMRRSHQRHGVSQKPRHGGHKGHGGLKGKAASPRRRRRRKLGVVSVDRALPVSIRCTLYYVPPCPLCPPC